MLEYKGLRVTISFKLYVLSLILISEKQYKEWTKIGANNKNDWWCSWVQYSTRVVALIKYSGPKPSKRTHTTEKFSDVTVWQIANKNDAIYQCPRISVTALTNGIDHRYSYYRNITRTVVVKRASEKQLYNRWLYTEE